MNFTPMQKIWLRFALIFYPLYIILNPNGFIPNIDSLYEWYIQPFHIFIPWVARVILHLHDPITHFTYGSGDTTYDYVMLLMVFLLALLGTAIWSAAERHRPGDYNTSFRWLMTLIRYYLAFSMFEYGFAKIFYLQFTFPSPGRLQQSFGNASPMGLVWTFFGYSRGYNLFTGLTEVISGLLLLFRRTTRIGALLTLTVMANVMAINYFYDVCVKLMSTSLVVMAIILIARDWRPHRDFLLFNRHAGPDEEKLPKFRRRRLNIALIVFKYLLIAYAIIGNLVQDIKYLHTYVADEHPPLAGTYDVHTFIRNRDTLPPLQTDTLRWRKLLVSYSGRASVRMMNDSTKGYNFLPDTIKKKIVMYTDTDTLRKYTLSYDRIGADSMVLHGSWRGDSVLITMKRFDERKFILVSRGFHMINETPFNR